MIEVTNESTGRLPVGTGVSESGENWSRNGNYGGGGDGSCFVSRTGANRNVYLLPTKKIMFM